MHGAIRQYLDSIRQKSAGLTPAAALELILQLYQEPVAGFSRDEDQDMLLFESGVYDFHDGDLVISLTRQFIHEDEEGDDEIIQAQAIFHYDPPTDPDEYKHSLWLGADPAAWAEEIKKTRVMQEFGRRLPKQLEIEVEEAE